MYYKVWQDLTRVEIQRDTGDFRLLDRRIFNETKNRPLYNGKREMNEN